MTAIVLADRTEWDVSQLHKVSPYVTAGELIAALSKVHPSTWVTVHGGPLRFVFWEPHANEPFVALSHESFIQKERIRPDGQVIG